MHLFTSSDLCCLCFSGRRFFPSLRGIFYRQRLFVWRHLSRPTTRLSLFASVRHNTINKTIFQCFFRTHKAVTIHITLKVFEGLVSSIVLYIQFC